MFRRFDLPFRHPFGVTGLMPTLFPEVSQTRRAGYCLVNPGEDVFAERGAKPYQMFGCGFGRAAVTVTEVLGSPRIVAKRSVQDPSCSLLAS